MLNRAKVEAALPGGPTVLVGRSSASRTEWEAAREADAADLNRLLETGGDVAAYVVPLWSNAEVARNLQELRGFDEARVYVVPAPGDDAEAALAAVAESNWAGIALFGGEENLATLLYAAAGLEIPMLLPDIEPGRAVQALALALDEELSPREIGAVLRGEDDRQPRASARAWAEELLGAGGP